MIIILSHKETITKIYNKIHFLIIFTVKVKDQDKKMMRFIDKMEIIMKVNG